MNCNCIDTIEQNVLDREKYDGRKIDSVKFISMAYMMPDFSIVTNSELELELEGLKRPKIVKINHTFCPFCGKSIKEANPQPEPRNS